MIDYREIDYREIGLKVGIEIHQRLDTHKLFCRCSSHMREESPTFVFSRKLRPVTGELGEVDPAASFEYYRDRIFEYQSFEGETCLIEADEEPPFPVNEEALDIGLEVAMLLNADIPNEIHVMRKTVIDGSNCTGFQRTLIVGMNGYLDSSLGRVGITNICLEEESARIVYAGFKEAKYKLSGLGIPLIEIGTSPDIITPEHAREVAEKIGMLLRSTGKVMRGIGTIRQDLNVSIEGGARVEIKGVQELKQLAKYVEYEARRQLSLLEIQDSLKDKTWKEPEIVDVTEIFEDTECKVLKNKDKILSISLSGFSGILKKELCPGHTFGKELSYYARTYGVPGILHTDEDLEKYGITNDEKIELYRSTGSTENDCIILVAGKENIARRALETIIDRASNAFSGPLEETRSANPDGTTYYTRPLPGAQRMYPETDVSPIVITKERLEKIARSLPELFEEKLKRFMKDYNLNKELARSLIRSDKTNLFEEIVNKYGVNPTLVATTLTNTLVTLKREGFAVDNLNENHFFEIFESFSKGMFSKEVLPEVVAYLSSNPSRSVKNCLEELRLKMLSEEELGKIIEEILEKDKETLKEKGEKSFGFFMGKVMELVRGRADGKVVSRLLKEKIEERV
ncbi:MAG: Glu-tRNA(Gln) amidotransferase subunit GatE [Candidatus Hydrothermarchaeota archaeon]